MTPVLTNIIEQAYIMFADYKVSKPLDVCTDCCVTDSEENALVSMSVRHIPFELLYTFNTAAKTEKPAVEEFKHFLPRFLELTAELKFLSHSAELSLSRFDYYSENEWTPAERKLLQDFSIEFFSSCLKIFPLPELERIDGIIVMLSKAYIDVDKLLSAWTATVTKESVLHLSDLINSGFKEYKPHELRSPFDKLNLGVKIVDWLNAIKSDDRFSNCIEEIMMNPESLEEYTLRELSSTYEMLKMKYTL